MTSFYSSPVVFGPALASAWGLGPCGLRLKLRRVPLSPVPGPARADNLARKAIVSGSLPGSTNPFSGTQSTQLQLLESPDRRIPPPHVGTGLAFFFK